MQAIEYSFYENGNIKEGRLLSSVTERMVPVFITTSESSEMMCLFSLVNHGKNSIIAVFKLKSLKK